MVINSCHVDHRGLTGEDGVLLYFAASILWFDDQNQDISTPVKLAGYSKHSKDSQKIVKLAGYSKHSKDSEKNSSRIF